MAPHCWCSQFKILKKQLHLSSAFVKTGDLFWSYEISLFYWSREYYHYHDINFNPTIVLCSTATFAVAILSSLCVEITEPLVRVWRHVRDHAQQVEGEHLVEDDSLLVQTILAQPGRGQQQQLDIFLESLPERILSRAFFAIVLMTRSRCLITAGEGCLAGLWQVAKAVAVRVIEWNVGTCSMCWTETWSFGSLYIAERRTL